MSKAIGRVVIGVDPHKLSATIEVVDQHEKNLGNGRFTTDHAGYKAMRAYASTWPDRVWAVEGANGAGRPLTQRLLTARTLSMSQPSSQPGFACSTPATTARPTPSRALRRCCRRPHQDPRVLHLDAELEVMRMLTDRRETLTRRRVQIVCRLQALLAEFLPGQAKKDLTSAQAKAMLASVRPRDIAGRTRRRIAAEEVSDLIAIEVKMKRPPPSSKRWSKPASHT